MLVYGGKKKKCFFFTLDYYSFFFERGSLENLTAKQVVGHVKSIFARHDIVVCKNELQFSRHEFKQFAVKFDFRSTTPSFCDL